MKQSARLKPAVAIAFVIVGILSYGIYYAHAAFTITATPPPVMQIVQQRVRSVIDDIGYLNLTADPAYFVQLKSVTITFAGSALSNGAAAFTVTLKSLTGTTPQTCTPSGNSCTVTFVPTYAVSAGATKSIKIRIDSTNFYDAPGVTETLTATIQNASDILWNDGVTDNIPLEDTNTPLIIATAQYI